MLNYIYIDMIVYFGSMMNMCPSQEDNDLITVDRNYKLHF